MNFPNLVVPNISFPDVNSLLDGDILDVIVNVFKFLFSLIVVFVDCILNFVDQLYTINTYISDLTLAINNGNVNGLPIIQVIGAYRFLVGDMIFQLTYAFVVFGCSFTLYKLFLVLYRRYKETKKEITATGHSAKGISTILNTFFK